MPDSASVAGQRVGPYTLERMLAEHSPIEWLVAHEAEGSARPVVIRRRRDDSDSGKSSAEQFLERARALTRLRCPSMVKVLHAAKENGAVYAAMEHVPGTDLGQLMALSVRDKRRMSPSLASGIVVEILACLQALHDIPMAGRATFLHGGLLPRRIRITETGMVKVGGMARELEDSADGAFYSSPEQLRHEPVDARSDVFAAGIILYELLTDVRPFPDLDSVATRSAMLYQPILPPKSRRADIPDALNDLVVRALSRDRRSRPESADAMMQELFVHGTLTEMEASARAQWWAELWPQLVAHPASSSNAVPVARPPSTRARTLRYVALGSLCAASLAGALALGSHWLNRSVETPSDMTGGMKPIPGMPFAPPRPTEPLAATTPPKPTTHPAPPGGTLTLITDPPADVYFKGRHLGHTPLLQIPLPVGALKLTLQFADRKRRTYPVEIKLDQNTIVRADLK